MPAPCLTAQKQTCSPSPPLQQLWQRRGHALLPAALGIRNAISVGGDSDTIAAITGSIAEGYYGVPYALWKQARQFLPIRLDNVVRAFYKRYDLN